MKQQTRHYSILLILCGFSILSAPAPVWASGVSSLATKAATKAVSGALSAGSAFFTGTAFTGPVSGLTPGASVLDFGGVGPSFSSAALSLTGSVSSAASTVLGGSAGSALSSAGSFLSGATGVDLSGAAAALTGGGFSIPGASSLLGGSGLSAGSVFSGAGSFLSGATGFSLPSGVTDILGGSSSLPGLASSFAGGLPGGFSLDSLGGSFASLAGGSFPLTSFTGGLPGGLGLDSLGGSFSSLAGGIPGADAVMGAVPGVGAALGAMSSVPGLGAVAGVAGSLPVVGGLLGGGGCYTYGAGSCRTNQATNLWWNPGNPKFSTKMQNYILQDIYTQKIIGDLWTQKIKPALQKMTAQNVATDTLRQASLGKMKDANQQLSAMRDLQEQTAQAYKDYTPSENVCRFGSNVGMLAAADLRAASVARALSKIILDRQLGVRGSGAATGPEDDQKSRLMMFKKTYCDPRDNNGLLIKGGVCEKGADPARYDKDINFARTVEFNQTLDVDFQDGKMSKDEQDVIALAHNLYGPEVMKRMTGAVAKDPSGGEGARNDYIANRNLIAIRNVAAAAFAQNVGVRSRAGDGQMFAANYMRAMLTEMGLAAGEATKYLDAGTGAPSYYAQMGVLAKMMYMNPNFYTNLMDKPANVDRQLASMTAIGLMQDRDTADVMGNQELMLSLLLEMQVRGAQVQAEGRANQATRGGGGQK